MKKYMKTIVPNSRPAYVAEPDNDPVIKIYLEPIVAWQVLYDDFEEDNDSAYAAPVTVPGMLPSTYAIYYSDTDMWRITQDDSDGEWGKGLDSLLEYFKEQNQTG